MHLLGLHDQDETSAGDRIDAATGQPYDFSTWTDDTYFASLGHIVTPSPRSNDVLGPVRDMNDEAAKWLLEHQSRQNSDITTKH